MSPLHTARVRDYMSGKLIAYHAEPGGPVADYMAADVQTVDANMSIVDLAELFMESGIRRYPVLDNNRLVGQISRRDVLRALGAIRLGN